MLVTTYKFNYLSFCLYCFQNIQTSNYFKLKKLLNFQTFLTGFLKPTSKFVLMNFLSSLYTAFFYFSNSNPGYKLQIIREFLGAVCWYARNASQKSKYS